MYDEERERIEAPFWAKAPRPGQRVRIIGPDYSGADDGAIGSLGHVSYNRGPWESWVYVDAWGMLGTTFPNTSLEILGEE